MQITRNNLETNAGPSEWFTGAVYLDPIASPAGSSRAHAVRVHFAPGARTAWHTHPHGQTIYILEGVGRAQGDPEPAVGPEPLLGGEVVGVELGGVDPHAAGGGGGVDQDEPLAGRERRLTASCAIWQSSTSTTRASPQPGVNTSPTRSTAPADTRD